MVAQLNTTRLQMKMENTNENEYAAFFLMFNMRVESELLFFPVWKTVYEV